MLPNGNPYRGINVYQGMENIIKLAKTQVENGIDPELAISRAHAFHAHWVSEIIDTVDCVEPVEKRDDLWTITCFDISAQIKFTDKYEVDIPYNYSRTDDSFSEFEEAVNYCKNKIIKYACIELGIEQS
jgi:hypothetical protein